VAQDRRQRLLDMIERAFRGVELGDGVSLHETVAIDNYVSAEERLAAREADEKHDWRRLITDPEFHRIAGIGGIPFYDSTGLRFHLPAYLSLAVIDFDSPMASGSLESLMFLLTCNSDYDELDRRLSILTSPQRACIREVLEFLRCEYELECSELDEAIDGYWRGVN
jgi:hypothetical protein